MFTQRISMDCTQEQYEKYLKAELEKMGYKEKSCSQWHKRENEYITNCYIGLGNVGNINKADIYNIVNDKLTYLVKFNAPLFLALAAMREGSFVGYGQYIIREADGCFIKNYGVGFYLSSRGFHIATVSEIMAKFGEQPQKGKIEFEVTFDAKSFKESVEKAYKFLEINDAEIDKISKRLDELGEQHTDLLNKVEYLQKRVDGDYKLQYMQPIYGELAIFWGDKKENAIISRFVGLDSEGYNFFINKNGYRFSLDNAILFESIEQYNEFIKS